MIPFSTGTFPLSGGPLAWAKGVGGRGLGRGIGTLVGFGRGISRVRFQGIWFPGPILANLIGNYFTERGFWPRQANPKGQVEPKVPKWKAQGGICVWERATESGPSKGPRGQNNPARKLGWLRKPEFLPQPGFSFFPGFGPRVPGRVANSLWVPLGLGGPSFVQPPG